MRGFDGPLIGDEPRTLGPDDLGANSHHNFFSFLIWPNPGLYLDLLLQSFLQTQLQQKY